jgi:RNA polymerase sigma-70 factor (ECF subfamily)
MSSPRPVRVTHTSPPRYNSAAMTDADLVQAVLRGDQSAFARLVDRHAAACLRYATRMLGNREDAEDAAQEMFVRAHSALARFDGSVAFRTWLMTILINRCRTMLDRRRTRDARFVHDHDAATSAPVESDAEASALRDAIEKALARLEPSQREAFLLKHVEQLSYDEMASITGSGVSALKMRVQRACERLQTLLSEEAS